MNIFYIDEDPEVAARQHIWPQHVVQMIREYGQLLSTAHRVLDGEPYQAKSEKSNRMITRYKLEDPEMEEFTYKATHVNHPSAVWVRQSARHYMWLYELFVNLNEEFSVQSVHKRGQDHHTFYTMGDLLKQLPKNLPDNGWVDPPQAMPEEFRVEGDSLAGYRNYYEYKKEKFNVESRKV